VEDLLKVLHSVPAGDRSIHEIVLHHTYDPDHATWRGDEGAAGILQYWKDSTEEKGWRHHLGGHLLVAPEGKVYLPFGDLAEPLNANSNPDINAHGIAIETVGNFDTGHDSLEGAQKHAVLALLAGLLLRFKLTKDRLFFHRSFENYKSCPGTGLSLSAIRGDMPAAMAYVRSVEAGKPALCPCCPAPEKAQ